MDTKKINEIFDKLLKGNKEAYKEFEQEQINDEIKDLKKNENKL